MLPARDGLAAYVVSPLITAILFAGAVFPGSPRAFQVLVFAAMLAALWGTGSRLARWLVPDFEPESRWTAAFTFAVGVAVVPATWMGHFGWMWPGPFLIWTAVAYAASRFLPAPGVARASASPPPGETAHWLKGLARIETVLLASAILALTFFGLFDMKRLRYAPAGPYGFDDISYHLAAVAVWLQSGDLRMIRFSVGDASTPFYPILGEVASWVLFVPFGDSDVVARWTQLPFAIFSFVAVAAIARRLGLSRWNAAFAALLFASIHRVFPVFALGAGNDHSMSFFTLAALDAGLALARRPRRGAAVATGAALGLLLATKYIGVLFTPVILAVIAAAALIERKRWEDVRPSPRALAGLAVLLAGVMAVTGGYTYLRNAAALGNPIFPAPVRIAGAEILPGWDHATIGHRKSAPEFFIDIPHFLTQRKDLFGPFFPFTMLPAAVLAPFLALARRRFVTAMVLALPAVFFLQFLFLMHDHRDMRYFLPGVALAALALAWLLAEAGPWASPVRAVLLALITYQVSRRMPMSGAREALFTLAMFAGGALAVQAWRWSQGRDRWRDEARRWGGLAAAAALGIAALSLGPSVEKYQRTKLRDRPAPLALESLAGPDGARVAYVGLNQPYLFFGSRLQNDVQIVPRDWNLEDQYFAWGGSAEAPYQAGRYRRWRTILDRLGVEYVVVARTQWADPERRWILRRTGEFRLVWEDQETEIWRVLPAQPEPGGRGGADRPGPGRGGRGRAPKPAPGSGSRSS
ncbi:MAG TPA: glycosyltransferase family 39 protein [Thermoanaerobaculia bacterium]|nr:glycosyltransferase family 39 protein [Thermoanaerobaculia bacterium]